MKAKWIPSTRAKLTIFVILLSTVLIGIVWLLNVQLLEPSYNNQIRADLQYTAQNIATLVSKYDSITDDTTSDGLNAEFASEFISSSFWSNLQGKCMEIADDKYAAVAHVHALSGHCMLHPTQNSMFGSVINWDSRTTYTLRRSVMASNEDLCFTMEDEGGAADQMVYGINVDGRYTVIVSTDLDRIGQAGKVVMGQMPLIAALMLLISVIGAFFFATWFTKPLSTISHAAREMAKGNYNVRVPVKSDDEIGELSKDFNIMAAEVARTSELQRDLIANISHDLRTPLTLIKGYAETVRDINGENKEKRNTQLNVIVDETDRLSGLVNSVMELSKYSSGTEKLQPVQFDLAQLCEEVAVRYDDICQKNVYTLEVHTGEECTVTADPDMMSRVIHNLVSNAIHHIGPDGWVGVSAQNTPDGVRVEVADHGCGIAAEDLPYIFDKYYRSRSDAGKVGTGLGLSITKAILVNHGFRYGVNSTVGKGATFWFIAK